MPIKEVANKKPFKRIVTKEFRIYEYLDKKGKTRFDIKNNGFSPLELAEFFKYTLKRLL